MDEVKFTVGRRTLLVRPFCLRGQVQLVKLEVDKRLQSTDRAEQLEAMADAIAVCLKRSQPDIDRDWVLDNVEVTEVQPLFALVMAVNGTKERPPGEAGAP